MRLVPSTAIAFWSSCHLLRNLPNTISCTAVDVEALSSAAKAVVQATGKEVVTFDEFQKVFIGEILSLFPQTSCL